MPEMQFDYLIFDADDTLLNFREAYSSAQQAVAARMGVPFSARFCRIDEELGWKFWEEYRLDKTDCLDVQENYHVYYTQCLRAQYKELCRIFQVSAPADELIDCYQNALAESRVEVEPMTKSVFAGLSGHYRNIIATNGVGWVQRSRLREFLPCTYDVFISEEISMIKPAKHFFDTILKRIKCAPHRCLMIGDSLTNDIAGAAEAGFRTCWYNHKKRKGSDAISPDFTIESIGMLREILL